jgi:DNA-binding FrmR family transcriptional regulator
VRGEDRMHTVREREKLIARVRRIRGQIEGIERARAADELVDIVHAYVK